MATLVTIDKYLYRAPFSLEAIGVDLPEIDEKHENRVPFHGILTRLDEASTRPPNGAKGDDGKNHKVLIPTTVAQEALPSLIGMPLDCSWRLDTHNKRQVIGVITRADIQGQDLVVAGHLYGKNFPDEIQEIKDKRDQLGMSYEIGSVLVEDPDADIWTLTSLQFTGAAILRKDAAAYQKTAIAANAEEDSLMALGDDLKTTLGAMGRKIDTIFAARHDDDEEDAKRHEEDARRHEEEARRAREDDDEDAARKHDEDAATAWVMAMRKHEEMAKKYEEDAKSEEDEDAKKACMDAAKKHDEDARRLKDEDARRNEDARRREEDAAKAKKPDDGDDEMARMGMLMSMFMRSMGYRHDEDGRRNDDEDAAGHGKKEQAMPLWARAMLHAMTYPSVSPSAKRRQSDAAHDDTAEDTALFRRLMQQHDKMDAGTSRSTPVDLDTRRRIRNLEASMQLLTDTVNKAVGLLTDNATSNRKLATDGNQGNNGGQAAVRKTMSAATESWLGKFDKTDNGEKMTAAEAEELCKGLSNRDAMTKKLELMAAGKL